MTESTDRLARLRRKLAATDDLEDRADLEAAIAALEAASPPPAPTQSIGGHAQIGVAVAGDVHGHIFLAGQRGKTAAELLEGYLRRVAQRCGTLPLQGVREQKTADDLLTIGLDQVYTQLATTVLVERERFEGAALTGFDARDYFAQHLGAELLPIQQRQLVRRPLTSQEEQQRRAQIQQALVPALAIERVEAPGEIRDLLDQLDADTLAQIAQQVQHLTFSGPQLVTEAIASSLRLIVLGEPGSGKSTVLRLAMVRIEAGMFVPGITSEQAEVEGLEHERGFREREDEAQAQRARKWPLNAINNRAVRIPAFEIARYPVTNAQYALFMQDAGYDRDKPWWDEAGRSWLARDDAATTDLIDRQRRRHKDRPERWEDARYGIVRPNYPVVGVSWYEAVAFSRWLTIHTAHNPHGYAYRLPSEIEWEYVARGSELRPYPWGEREPDGELANFDQIYGGTTAVGCFASDATPEGVYDLAGNVWEWTRSVRAPYPYDPADGREDPATPNATQYTIRGGSWSAHPLRLRGYVRNSRPPDTSQNNLGFRLVRHLKM